jgi:hypothetical protein
MAQQQTTTCDNPSCRKDITKGAGRYWRLTVNGERIACDPAIPLRHNGHSAVVGVAHFCDFKCLSAWSAGMAVADDAAQKKLDDDKAAEAAKKT